MTSSSRSTSIRSPRFFAQNHQVVGKAAEAAAVVPVEQPEKPAQDGPAPPEPSNDRDRGRRQRIEQEPAAMHGVNFEVRYKKPNDLLRTVMAVPLHIFCELVAFKPRRARRDAAEPRKEALRRFPDIAGIEKGKKTRMGRREDQGALGLEGSAYLLDRGGVRGGVLDDFEHHDRVERALPERKMLHVTTDERNSRMPFGRRLERGRVDVEADHPLRARAIMPGQISTRATDLEQPFARRKPSRRLMGLLRADLRHDFLADDHACLR